MKTAKRNHETVDNECTNMFASVCVRVCAKGRDRQEATGKKRNI